MSYDVYIDIDTGGEYAATVETIGNITYNLGPMFRTALGCPLRDLNGRNCAEVLPLARKAVADMQDRPAVYRQMNPENGWGNADLARDFLTRLVNGCASHPKAYVSVT